MSSTLWERRPRRDAAIERRGRRCEGLNRGEAPLPRSLAQPVAPDTTPAVPEPDDWAMMLAGLGMIALSAARRIGR